jgi:hypothetical protein
MAENQENTQNDKIGDINNTYTEEKKAYERDHYEKNKPSILARRKELYHQKHKQYKAQYYQENKDAINDVSRIRHAQLYVNSIEFRNITLFRRRINAALQGTKSKFIHNLTGLPLHTFKYYLESHFEPGMSWDNRKEWHIDHIVPVSSFDITQLADIKKCYHYTNLRPMWANDNLHKAATPPSPSNPESTKPTDPEPTQIPADTNRT